MQLRTYTNQVTGNKTMTDKTQPTGAGVPAAQLDAILLAMHLRQRAKLTATGNADALSQNAANVLVAQYDRIAELEALQAAPPAPAAVAVPELSLTDEQIEQAFISARDEFMLREVERTDKKLRLAFGRAVLHSARAALAAAPAQAWPSECDSPELCRVHRGCAGQYGTKKTCHSFAVLNPCNPAAPAQAVAVAELDMDRVLSIADVHAEESREDGTRLLDRGGLVAFAKDVLRVAGTPAQEHATQLAMPILAQH